MSIRVPSADSPEEWPSNPTWLNYDQLEIASTDDGTGATVLTDTSGDVGDDAWIRVESDAHVYDIGPARGDGGRHR